ncbi:MAG: L,D-transpeptidase [Longimicrobiales bacterium]
MRRPVPAAPARVFALLVAIVAVPTMAAAQAPDTGSGTGGPGRVAVREPEHADGRRILRLADAHDGTKILVSTEQRRLWLVSAGDTVMSVPVAIGMGRSFEFEGRRFWFETPRSKRQVLRKQESPLWNVPEWHYLERAKAQGLEVVMLTKDDKILLADGSFILTIGNNVGRLNSFGNFWPFTPGNEIIFGGTVYVPPKGTNQRLVPDALGPYKLDTGDGYLIHGTHIYNEDSIGEAVSHGCVRMRNEDLERLYERVPVGTAVYIF